VGLKLADDETVAERVVVPVIDAEVVGVLVADDVADAVGDVAGVFVLVWV